MDWIKDSKYTNTYYITKKFNDFQYKVLFITEETGKTVKCWIHVSSGKKRKEFEIFEEKLNKSLGGVKALFWVKEAMYDFPEYLKNKVPCKQFYLCIGWADARRRDIYKRLENEGFQFMIEGGVKILMKKV